MLNTIRKTWFARKQQRQTVERRAFIPSLEALEDRLFLTSSTWKPLADAVNPVWDNRDNWTAGIPGITAMVDEAVFDGTSTKPCSVDVGGITIKKLTIDAAYTGTIKLDGSPLRVSGVGASCALGGGILDGPGRLVVMQGTFEWTGGTIKNGINPGGVVLEHSVTGTISGSGAKTIDGSFLRNYGNVTWTGSGNIDLKNGGFIENLKSVAEGATDALFKAQASGQITSALSDTAAKFIVGLGAVMESAPASSQTHIGVWFSNAGVVKIISGHLWLPFGLSTFGNGTATTIATRGKYDIAALSELRLGFGLHTFDSAFADGNGTVVLWPAAELRILGNATIRKLSDTGDHGTGTGPSLLSGTGTLNILNKYDWNGATWSGSGSTQIAAGAELKIADSTSADIIVNGRKLANYGIVTWTSTQNLLYSNGAEITNHPTALFDIKTDADLRDAGGAGWFTNKPTAHLRKSAGTGVTEFQLNYTGGGRVSVETGSFKATKLLKLIEDFLEVFSSARLECANGLIEESGTATVAAGGRVDVIGAFDYTGGAFEMTDAILSTTANFNIGAAVEFDGTGLIVGNVVNAGTWTLAGSVGAPAELDVDGSVTQTVGSLAVSSAQLEITQDLTLSGGSASVSLCTILVGDDFVQTGGSSTVMGYGGHLDVNGDYTHSGGTITVGGTGGLVSVDGTFVVSGGVFGINNGLVNALNGLTIQSLGTVSVTNSGTITGKVTNDGTLTLAASALLQINGDYKQTGTLNVTLAGTSPLMYSRLAVSGLATLGGTLNVGLASGYSPSPMSQFTILTYGSRSGTFSGHNLPPLSVGVWQDPLLGYESDRFTLRTLYL